MSDGESADLASLAEILAQPDTDEARPPDARAEETDADDDSAEEVELSPEELVAELARQDAEEAGEAFDDEDDDDDEEEPDEIEQLRARAQLVDQWEAWNAQRQVYEAAQQLQSHVQQRVAQAEQHYDAELRRITDAIRRDAYNAPDPDQYLATHIPAATRDWAYAREAWIQGIYTDARAYAQSLQQHAGRDQYADRLIAEHGLPNAPQVKAKLLQVSDPNRMPERARELAEMHRQFQLVYASADQKVREAEARKVKAAQVASSATGTPRRAKQKTYQGTKAELAEILKFERTG